MGAGLGAQQASLAALAAQRLGSDAGMGATSVRFWGKVLGVHADYYVFEATLRPAIAAAGAPCSSVARSAPLPATLCSGFACSMHTRLAVDISNVKVVRPQQAPAQPMTQLECPCGCLTALYTRQH